MLIIFFFYFFFIFFFLLPQITKATHASNISTEELPKARAELAAAIEEKKSVHTWTIEDYYRRYPGLEEQLRAEFMNGDYLLTDTQEKLEATDFAEVRKAFRAGLPLPLPDVHATHVGDLSIKGEYQKVEAMLDKMYSGLPLYEEQKIKNRAAMKKIEQMEKEQQENEHHH